MSQIFRFFEETSFTPHSSFSLSGESNRILSRVLRMTEGKTIQILNGEGDVAIATIERMGSKTSDLRIVQVIQHLRMEPSIELFIGCLKGEKLSWVVQKAAELGASRIAFFNSNHSVATKSPAFLEKSKKTLIEAIRQSGNPFLPKLDFYKDLKEIKLNKSNSHWNLVLDETKNIFFSTLMQKPKPSSISIFVGPEGGFSEDEKLFFEREGCYSIKIAPYVLRSETAALSALASCTAYWKEIK